MLAKVNPCFIVAKLFRLALLFSWWRSGTRLEQPEKSQTTASLDRQVRFRKKFSPVIFWLTENHLSFHHPNTSCWIWKNTTRFLLIFTKGLFTEILQIQSQFFIIIIMGNLCSPRPDQENTSSTTTPPKDNTKAQGKPNSSFEQNVPSGKKLLLVGAGDSGKST